MTIKYLNKIALTLTAISLSMVGNKASAAVIGFEDLNTRSSFNDLGIIDNYQGYEWGYGNTAGVAGRTFVNANTGWASATSSSPVIAPPSNLGGNSYAWTFNGPQSLWIDFKSPTTFNGGDFAVLSSTYSSNASSLTLFGYDAASNLTDSSSTLSLTNTFQTLNTNFQDIQYLEIRSNSDSRWFSVDNLRVGEATSVPEPFTVIGTIVGGTAAFRMRKKLKAISK
jgi:hypothetical protein